jgi:hypothetical protein
LIAVDSNLLVHAHRRDSPWHRAARRCVAALVEAPAPWAIPWPCLFEFFSVATNPRIFRPASTTAEGIGQIDAWIASPSVHLLAEEGTEPWPVLRALLANGRVRGALVHDARIAMLCLHHGVRELWTADRDFSRFPALVTRNPLVG